MINMNFVYGDDKAIREDSFFLQRFVCVNSKCQQAVTANGSIQHKQERSVEPSKFRNTLNVVLRYLTDGKRRRRSP